MIVRIPLSHRDTSGKTREANIEVPVVYKIFSKIHNCELWKVKYSDGITDYVFPATCEVIDADWKEN